MSSPDNNDNQIKTVPIAGEVKKAYLDYAMSVIVSRALPDVRDGLKPVHRRILYAAYQINLSHTSAFTKSAKLVGEVLGKYHPHGDASVYDALVRLAQDFSMRYPLIQGQGNFGSIDGDPPAAMRYTEIRLSKIAQEMLKDLEKETVPTLPNFDGTLAEPQYLPALLPNLLLMGSEGIAVGMATKIPPHNLGEVVRALILIIEKGKATFPQTHPLGQKEINNQEKESFYQKLLEMPFEEVANFLPNFETEASLDDILTIIKGPDFPTYGAIFGKKQIQEAYQKGRGSILVRGKADIEEVRKNRLAIIISQLPYQVNKALLVQKIADLIREQKIKGVGDLRDESSREGIRIVLELQRQAKPQAILNNLYKKTDLETTFPANFVALLNGVPQTLGLREILLHYVTHRQEIVFRRTIFDLRAAQGRAHILEGLKIALDYLDEVIKTIRTSANTSEAQKNLMEKFSLSALQSEAILNMPLKRLSRLEREKIEEEYQLIQKQIKEYKTTLEKPEKILKIIKEELGYLLENYEDGRRTQVFASLPGELAEEDLVANEPVIITITKQGYIKRLAKNVYRPQRRGGKGITGMTTKEEDEVKQVLSAQTHDQIIFFTNQGKAFRLPVWEIPEGNRQSRGKAVVNLINLEGEEKVEATLIIPKEKSEEKKYLILTTKKGMVKKSLLEEFSKIRANGLLAIKLRPGDQLCWAKTSRERDHLLLVTAFGQSIRFSQEEIRTTARDTIGVGGIRLKKDDYLVGAEVIPPKVVIKDRRRKPYQRLLLVTQKGLGKQTDLDAFPRQHRYGKGVKAARINKKTGLVCEVKIITEKDQDLIITSQKGHLIKLPLKNIPVLGRNTQGVILMRFKDENDQVASVATTRG